VQQDLDFIVSLQASFGREAESPFGEVQQGLRQVRTQSQATLSAFEANRSPRNLAGRRPPIGRGLSRFGIQGRHLFKKMPV
jgi:hypothetical protein